MSRDNGDQKVENASQLARFTVRNSENVNFIFILFVRHDTFELQYSLALRHGVLVDTRLASPHVEVVVLLLLDYCTVQ